MLFYLVILSSFSLSLSLYRSDIFIFISCTRLSFILFLFLETPLPSLTFTRMDICIKKTRLFTQFLNLGKNYTSLKFYLIFIWKKKNPLIMVTKSKKEALFFLYSVKCTEQTQKINSSNFVFARNDQIIKIFFYFASGSLGMLFFWEFQPTRRIFVFILKRLRAYIKTTTRARNKELFYVSRF